jgi:hypothetical protein
VDPEAQAVRQQYLEEQKLAFEFVKHMTTLATGTIVLLATFLRDLFGHPEWRGLIPLTFASFIVATIALSGAAFGLLQSIRHAEAVPSAVRSFTGVSALTGMASLVTGLLLLSVFAIKNWV